MVLYMKKQNFTLSKLFTKLDKDRDNKISRKEFSSFLTDTIDLKLNLQEINTAMSAFDTSKDQVINLKEFV